MAGRHAGRHLTLLAVIVTASIVGACGGSGSDATSTSPRVDPTPRSTVATDTTDTTDAAGTTDTTGTTTEAPRATDASEATAGSSTAAPSEVIATSYELSSMDLFTSSVLADGSLWASVMVPGEVWRVSLDDGTVEARIPVGLDPQRLVFDGSSLWVSSLQSGTVERIDPVSEQVTASYALADVAPEALAFGDLAHDGERLWIAAVRGPVLALDPATGQLVASVDVGASVERIVFDGTWLWVAAWEVGIVRIDPASAEMIEVLAAPDGEFDAEVAELIWDGTWVWGWNSDGWLVRLDPDTSAVERIELGWGINAIASDGRAVWVHMADELWRVDADTLEAVDVATASWGSVSSMTVDGETLWATIGGPATVVRVDLARVAAG